MEFYRKKAAFKINLYKRGKKTLDDEGQGQVGGAVRTEVLMRKGMIRGEVEGADRSSDTGAESGQKTYHRTTILYT